MLALVVNAFLAPDNFLGWTIADLIALLATIALAFVLRGRPFAAPPWLRSFAERTGWCMVLLGLLPIFLRLLLLIHFGVPVPSGADDFGYLLLADTLRHARLANPPNPFPDAFAQIFVLQSPKYAAIFPLGQGLVLLGGQLVAGLPWAGVLCVSGILCAVAYWMLRAWTTPVLSLLGGLWAVIQFGPLCYWMNCYWGGYVSAVAGCLAFGALGRLRRAPNRAMSFLLGCGVAIQSITRPYETILLVASLFVFGIAKIRPWWIALLPVASAAILIGFQNRVITGHWTRLPYAQYRFEYGIPATFTFEPNPVPHAELNEEQALDYRMESAVHGDRPESVSRYFGRLLGRVRFLRFFWSAPLLLLVLAGVIRRKPDKEWWQLFLAVAVFVAGSNFYPYFYPHYIAAACCLLLLLVCGATQRVGAALTTSVVIVSLAQFVVWYAFHLAGKTPGAEAWDFVNPNDPQGRRTIQRMLDHAGGMQIVFVHNGPEHGFAEWVHNTADPAASPVIWVHDRGRDRNREVLEHYAGRRAWWLKPDEFPPRLEPYVPSSQPFEDVP